MHTRACEVIGCRLPAVWERMSDGDSDPESLCGPHYNELRLRQPDETLRFRPIAHQPLGSAVVIARVPEIEKSAVPH